MEHEQNVASVIHMYCELRAKEAEIKASIVEPLATIKQQKAQIESALLRYMQKHGLERLPTKEGTAYQSPKTNVSCSDWAAALDFIRDEQAWHLLERRLNPTAVKEYIEEGIHVPGAKISTVINVNVRSK